MEAAVLILTLTVGQYFGTSSTLPLNQCQIERIEAGYCQQGEATDYCLCWSPELEATETEGDYQ